MKAILFFLLTMILSVGIYIQEIRIFDGEASLRSAFNHARARLRVLKNPFWTREELDWAREEAQMAQRELVGEVFRG